MTEYPAYEKRAVLHGALHLLSILTARRSTPVRKTSSADSLPNGRSANGHSSRCSTFVRDHHRAVLATTRADGGVQLSPVAATADSERTDRRELPRDRHEDPQPEPTSEGLALRLRGRVLREVVPSRRTGRGGLTCPKPWTVSSSTTARSPESIPTGRSTAGRCEKRSGSCYE